MLPKYFLAAKFKYRMTLSNDFGYLTNSLLVVYGAFNTQPHPSLFFSKKLLLYNNNSVTLHI